MLLEYEDIRRFCPYLSEKASPGLAANELRGIVDAAQNPSVGSRNSLLQARIWLEKCYSAHGLCPITPNDFAPTRLLDLKPADETGFLSLVSTIQKPNMKWVALSYVWGGDQTFKTTLSSLTSMHEKVSILALPRTLQDAIIVCVALGVRYLWIDCICIAQDDEEDLARELAIMPLIYHRAWVTISASTADTVSTGFLHDQGYWTSIVKTPVLLPYRSEDGIIAGNISKK
ncbi:hypothetical protein G6011_09913 [Alternaria panax]|uniref:Heterokaryon incompatibility domain-containing protein n=1 Tax=Alternaria panax TaxID=48097 RepID=A0AAD4FBE4_9PLEO|nr:hypothetical protein G6011_09913 [Alternaria panax]